MSPHIRAAHERLLATLPVRTYTKPEISGERGPAPRRSHVGLARPVIVNGITYESITKAKTRLHVAPATLYAWLRDGRAQYA